MLSEVFRKSASKGFLSTLVSPLCVYIITRLFAICKMQYCTNVSISNCATGRNARTHIDTLQIPLYNIRVVCLENVKCKVQSAKFDLHFAFCIFNFTFKRPALPSRPLVLHFYYTIPCAIMASATFRKPAMFAPAT